MRRLHLLHAALMSLLGGLCGFSLLVRRSRLNAAVAELTISEDAGVRLAKERDEWKVAAEVANKLAITRADEVERLKARIARLDADKALAESEAGRLGGKVASLEEKLADARHAIDAVRIAVEDCGLPPLITPIKMHRPQKARS